MSIKPDNILINSSLYTRTWKDDIYNSLMNILYQKGILTTTVNKAWKKEERGICDIDTWYQVYYYQIFIDYLIAYLEDKGGQCLTSDQLNDLINSYNFKCIRSTFVCKFKNPEILDAMLRAIGYDSTDGLDFMVEEGASGDCISDWIIV